jgi:hypothetical protein
MTEMNDNLVLIGGESSGGKSASLRNLENPEGVMYLNCESNKKLPFPAKFQQFSITDPYQVYEGFEHAATNQGNFHTIVIDTLTMLMDMFESIHVLPAKDTMKGWSNYQQYFKKLMQDYVAKSSCNIIILAHVQAILNESAMVMEKKVPIKGALKQNGIEAYFSTVVSARRIPINELEKYESPLLNITEEEEMLGFKHVYQTKLTKETVNERIRASMGMWDTKETFIDNDAQLLLNRLHEYYGSATAAA